ncbi:MAG: phosphate ABC transporter permease PstA [Rhodospirillaceae bacterium]|jgi:phosphate transport system permease protein|nr:phosphate ABC transporter permease PstA [Rhodospirillaceae bacterium]MBT5666701.1 phosphate ABC transporter permease PstA [Rhodospirillaceae bacterium]MBT5812386.1 phosphate ABC transporter permease PstA [Rhodospirillaceae bacterium]
MTDTPTISKMSQAKVGIEEQVRAGIKRRYAAERRFRLYGMLSITIALSFLAILIVTVALQGYTAFEQTKIRLDINFAQDVIDPTGTRDVKAMSGANYRMLARKSFGALFPDVTARRDKRKLYKLLSIGAPFELRAMVLADPSLIGGRRTVWLTASDDVDQTVKNRISSGGGNTRLSGRQIAWITKLATQDRIETQFNTAFFLGGDSREPELAGVFGAAAGSFWTLVVTLVLSFPLGVMTAIYLEEFAPKNWWTDLIEININNLAAVPSIVFGLLGLAVFLQLFGVPRSAPLAGGIVLALMTLPTIIIAARAALKAVPPSIREAAIGIGASRMQTVAHHVLPLAMPGVLTGAILGMARALGETAPLLMIGMVAFIVDIPSSPMDPATALPVQIYLWADSPERAFVERTSGAILVLLGFMICMNLIAILLRKKFEQRW